MSRPGQELLLIYLVVQVGRYLSVSIAPHITVMTSNNDLSEIFEHTLIDPSSNVFTQAISLSKNNK